MTDLGYALREDWRSGHTFATWWVLDADAARVLAAERLRWWQQQASDTRPHRVTVVQVGRAVHRIHETDDGPCRNRGCPSAPAAGFQPAPVVTP